MRTAGRVAGVDTEFQELVSELLAIGSKRGCTRVGTGDVHASRGFDTVILGRSGRPQYYCKYRPADDEAFARASHLAEWLSAHPSLAGNVPWTRCARGGTIQLQISAYVTGKPYQRLVATSDISRWISTADEVLRLGERVTAAAAEVRGDAPNAVPIDLAAASAPALASLSAAALRPKCCDALERILARGGALTSQAQHGDLWPGNLLQTRDSWWLLDYELLGEIRAPLYDAFHLVRTSCRLRGARPGSWIAFLLTDAPDATAARHILGRAIGRLRLSPDQIAAALAYYLIDFAARLHRRAGASDYWRPVVADAERLAELEVSGRDIGTHLALDSVSDPSCAALPAC